VDIGTESYGVAREYMVRLGGRDAADPAWLAKLAAASGLGQEAFVARFARQLAA
jgi:protein-disulfide isomerase-like protein with CxxC motif